MKIKKLKIWKVLNIFKFKKINKEIEYLLYSLGGIFVLILSFFVIDFGDIIQRKLFPIVGVLGLLFLILGIALIVFAKKKKRKKDEKLRLFLLMTGVSSIAPLVFTILHNFFYALGIAFENLVVIFEGLHALFFILGLAVAPVLFIVGWVGSIILMKKK